MKDLFSNYLASTDFFIFDHEPTDSDVTYYEPLDSVSKNECELSEILYLNMRNKLNQLITTRVMSLILNLRKIQSLIPKYYSNILTYPLPENFELNFSLNVRSCIIKMS